MVRMTGMLLAAGAFVALGLRAVDAPATTDTREEIRVAVTVAGCDQDAVTITISPWRATVRPEDDLVWEATGADAVEIRPLTQGWPFPTQTPRAARGAAQSAVASAGQLARGRAQEGQVFRYEIVLTCGGRELRIDPDVIIGPG